MHPANELERHREFIASLAMVVLACRDSSGIDDQRALLKAACACALSSLNDDLQAIAEIEEQFNQSHGSGHP